MPEPFFERYVAIGDSSTVGIDDPDGAGGYRGWSLRLAERLDAGSGKLLYANLAVRGVTTAEVRERQLAPALAMRPDVATLFCGTNDVTALRFDVNRVAANVEYMQRALAAAGATVLTFTLPDLTPVMPLARLIRSRIVELNQAVTAASIRTGTRLVDFAAYPVAHDARLWSEDRIHANSAGHERMAAALAQALQLPGTNDAWRQSMPAAIAPSFAQRCAQELRWAIRHFLPWLLSSLWQPDSAATAQPKRPSLSPLENEN